MNSFIHYLWIGPSFPLNVKQTIVRWFKHLRRNKANQFQIILWLNHDSFAEFFAKTDEINANKEFKTIRIIPPQKSQKSNWFAYFNELTDIVFIKISIDGCVFHIGLIENLIAVYDQNYRTTITEKNIFLPLSEDRNYCLSKLGHPITGKKYTEYYNKFYINKCYPFLSDFLRILILNEMPGIYMDVDTMPAEEPFFKDIEEVRLQLPRLSEAYFFLNPTIKHNFENQVIIYCPINHNPYEINRILDIGILLLEDSDALDDALRLYGEFNDNPGINDLKKSNYTEEAHRPIMTAYRERNATALRKETAKLFQGQYFSDGTSLLEYGKLPSEKISYILQIFYTMTSHYFKKINRSYNSIAREKINQTYKKMIGSYEQSEFFNIHQDKKTATLVYSWSYPAFSRLSKLEWAAKTIQSHYRNNRNPTPRKNRYESYV